MGKESWIISERERERELKKQTKTTKMECQKMRFNDHFAERKR